jgi:Holliday junction resolvase
MSNYSIGANFERRLIKYLREQGFRAHRTAGSHTPIDVIAGIAGRCYAFQVQIDRYFPPAKIEALKDEAKEFGAIPFIAWREGKELEMEELE